MLVPKDSFNIKRTIKVEFYLFIELLETSRVDKSLPRKEPEESVEGKGLGWRH